MTYYWQSIDFIKLALCGVLLCGVIRSANAQETVQISEPSFVSFSVDNVGFSTTSSPSSVRVSFSNANLEPGHRLRISVMADSSDFNPPASGGTIDSSNVSWSITGTQGGSGSSGTLSFASFTEVYESMSDPLSGSVDLRFTLDAPGTGVRAGDHSLSLRWQFESVP